MFTLFATLIVASITYWFINRVRKTRNRKSITAPTDIPKSCILQSMINDLKSIPAEQWNYQIGHYRYLTPPGRRYVVMIDDNEAWLQDTERYGGLFTTVERHTLYGWAYKIIEQIGDIEANKRREEEMRRLAEKFPQCFNK